MNNDWKIRVQPAGRTPFEFKATLLCDAAPDGRSSPLDVRYLYGDGDLAVLLEDLGAVPPGHLRPDRGRSSGRAVAEIPVDVTDEAMEMLAHRRREARA